MVKYYPSVEELVKVTPRIMCHVVGCEKILPHTSALKMHLSQTHSIGLALRKMKKKEAAEYHCPGENCIYRENFSFSGMKNLKQHYMKVHADKKYRCTKCQKCFGLERDCVRHEKRCGVIYHCSTCDCPYTTVEAMLTHCRRKAHDPPSGCLSDERTSRSRMKRAHDTNIVVLNILPTSATSAFGACNPMIVSGFSSNAVSHLKPHKVPSCTSPSGCQSTERHCTEPSTQIAISTTDCRPVGCTVPRPIQPKPVVSHYTTDTVPLTNHDIAQCSTSSRDIPQCISKQMLATPKKALSQATNRVAKASCVKTVSSASMVGDQCEATENSASFGRQVNVESLTHLSSRKQARSRRTASSNLRGSLKKTGTRAKSSSRVSQEIVGNEDCTTPYSIDELYYDIGIQTNSIFSDLSSDVANIATQTHKSSFAETAFTNIPIDGYESGVNDWLNYFSVQEIDSIVERERRKLQFMDSLGVVAHPPTTKSNGGIHIQTQTYVSNTLPGVNMETQTNVDGSSAKQRATASWNKTGELQRTNTECLWDTFLMHINTETPSIQTGRVDNLVDMATLSKPNDNSGSVENMDEILLGNDDLDDERGTNFLDSSMTDIQTQTSMWDMIFNDMETQTIDDFLLGDVVLTDTETQTV